MVRLTGALRVFNNPGFRKWYFNLEGYNKYGLYHDDLVEPESPLTKEAIRRLPAEEYDAHVFRVVRASQLEITKSFVPPEERPTYEEDQTKGRFLQPYLKEIEAEKKEKEQWMDFLAKK